MASRQTDVTMVIKARDEAAKAVLSITDAIKQLTGAQDGLVRSGGASASLLDQLKAAADGLAVAVQKADDSVDRAAASFERQQKSLAETKEQLAAVTAQMEAADKAAASLNERFASGPQIQKYAAQLAAVGQEQKNLAAQAKQLTTSIASQQAQIEKSQASLQSVRGAVGAAGSAATFAVIPPETAVTAEAAAEAVGQFARSLAPIAPTAQESASGTRTLWAEIKSLAASLAVIPGAAGQTANATSALAERSAATTQAIHLLRYELLSMVFAFVGPYGIVSAIGSVLNSYQALQSAENKLGVVFNQNTVQVRTEMDFLREQSVRLGLSFTQLADQYSTLAVNAQAAGFSLDNTRKLFLSITEAGRVLHLSQDDLNRIFIAFQEMLSKGKVQTIQLQRQLGNDMPGAVQLFADALGLSTAKLDEMMKKGEVFADQDTLTKVADRLQEKYGKQLPQALQTAQTQIGRFQALLQQMEIQVGQGGFIDQLNIGLAQLNRYLQSNDARSFFAQLGSLLGKIVSLVPVIARNFGLITDAFKAWISVRVGTFLLDLVAKMGSITVAARAMWTAIGGLPGVLLSGATFVLTSFLGDWLTGVDKATEALDEHERILEAVQKGYETAGKSVDGWAQRIKDTTEAQVLGNLNLLKAQAAVTKQNLPSAPQLLSTGSDVPDVNAESPLAKQLDDIIQKFRDGKTSYDDFKKAVSDFGVAHPDFLQFTKDVLDQAEKFGRLQTAIGKTEAILRVLGGTASTADLKTLGLGADGWNAATTAAQGFGDALDNIRKQVPDLKRQLQFQTNLDQAKSSYIDAVNKALQGMGAQDGSPEAVIRAATTGAKLAEAKEIYDQVVEKIHAYAAADTAKNFPIDNKAIIERIIYVEGGYAAKNNPASSAYGVGQFTKDTWLQIFDQIRPALADLSDAAKLALRANADVAHDALELETKQNQLALANAGIPVTGGNTYLAHFLGAAGAIKMILANPQELAADIASKSAVHANPTILGNGHTVADVLNFANTKMGGTSPITSTGETEAEKVTQALQDQIKAWQDDTQAMVDANAAAKRFGDGAERALFVQRQINEWQQKFKDAGAAGQFGPEQRAAIESYAGALFDVQHAAQTAQKAVDGVVGLSEQRATAITELQNAFKDGSDLATIDALKQKIADLTQKILDGLPAAQAWAAALGDQKMIESLDKVNLQLKTLKTGLTDAKQMNTLVAESVTSAWDNFTQSLQQGQNILQALAQTFLQFAQDFIKQIADMILKQTILNSLQGTNVGKWLSNFVNGATETDGAGSKALSTAGVTLGTAGKGLVDAALALQQAAASLSASGSTSGSGGFFGSLLSLFGSGATDGFDALDPAAQAAIMFHGGGVVGTGSGMRRSVMGSIFEGAKRFHSGGLPGLRPGEVPAILKRNEEVLTQDDPRHIFNAGKNDPRSADKSGVEVHIFNGFDEGELVSKGLGTRVGVKTILNLISTNKSAFRAALS